MTKSGIAQRMQQNHRRFLRPVRINLVSLMDIFTILVFFLLVNSGDTEILHVALALGLRYLGDQHTGLGHDPEALRV